MNLLQLSTLNLRTWQYSTLSSQCLFSIPVVIWIDGLEQCKPDTALHSLEELRKQIQNW